MGFLRRANAEESGSGEDRERLRAGGITHHADERLRALAGSDEMFTSSLSVGAFAILREMGPRPLAQVMGASVVRPGWQFLPALTPGMVPMVNTWTQGGLTAAPRFSGRMYGEASRAQTHAYRWASDVVCELDTLTEAWNLARRRALHRLTEEALEVGADAVAGVSLERSDHDLGRGIIEYVVRGTAVRRDGTDPPPGPILSDLSVQDLWRLAQLGQEPVGLVATTSVQFASPSRQTWMSRARSTSTPQEMVEVTRAFAAARRTVRASLASQVRTLGASGVVGVELDHSVHREKFALASSIASKEMRGWTRGPIGIPAYSSGHSDVERRGWVVTMHGAGTAIRPARAENRPDVKTTVRMGAR